MDPVFIIDNGDGWLAARVTECPTVDDFISAIEDQYDPEYGVEAAASRNSIQRRWRTEREEPHAGGDLLYELADESTPGAFELWEIIL